MKITLKKTKTVVVAMIILFFANSGSLVHGQVVYREHRLKAAFLYNFAKFVTWPDDTFENSQSPIIIGVLGEGPLVEALKSIEGKTAQDRKIVVKNFNAEKDIDICHILYFSSSQNNRLNQLLNNGLSGRDILTVGSMNQFTQIGGVINFRAVLLSLAREWVGHFILPLVCPRHPARQPGVAAGQSIPGDR